MLIKNHHTHPGNSVPREPASMLGIVCLNVSSSDKNESNAYSCCRLVLEWHHKTKQHTTAIMFDNSSGSGWSGARAERAPLQAPLGGAFRFSLCSKKTIDSWRSGPCCTAIQKATMFVFTYHLQVRNWQYLKFWLPGC